jgi:RNA 2',3'-cyclic 3'-phosphodiesterase
MPGSCYIDNLGRAMMLQDVEQVRSFIAIELPQDVKNGLHRIAHKIKEGGHLGIKWANPEGVHITLKFLGNISTTQITAIKKVIQETTQGFPSFYLEIAGLGAFPDLMRPRVLWVSINGEIDKLSELQQKLDSLLVSCDFPKENRPFVPHLTLARIKDSVLPEERRNIGTFINPLRIEDSISFDVQTVSLMRSQLTPKGAVYSCLSVSKLREEKVKRFLRVES